jgi:hypothetical protein
MLRHYSAGSHDLPHRPAAGAVDAGHQLDLPCPAAATVVAHTLDDLARFPYPE